MSSMGFRINSLNLIMFFFLQYLWNKNFFYRYKNNEIRRQFYYNYIMYTRQFSFAQYITISLFSQKVTVDIDCQFLHSPYNIQFGVKFGWLPYQTSLTDN